MVILFWSRLYSEVKSSVSVLVFKGKLEIFKKSNFSNVNFIIKLMQDAGQSWDVSHKVLSRTEGNNYSRASLICGSWGSRFWKNNRVLERSAFHRGTHNFAAKICTAYVRDKNYFHHIKSIMRV